MQKIGYLIYKKDIIENEQKHELLNSHGCSVIHQDKVPELMSERPKLFEILSNLEIGTTLITDSFFTLFSSLDSFNSILNLVDKFDLTIILLKENITIDSSNQLHYTTIWQDLMNFSYQALK